MTMMTGLSPREKKRGFSFWLKNPFKSKDPKPETGPWPGHLRILEFASKDVEGDFRTVRVSDTMTLSQAGLNFLFIGAPGSGKSVALETPVRGLLRIGSSAIFFVYKRQSTRDYQRWAAREGIPEKNVIVIRASEDPTGSPTYAINALEIEATKHGSHGAVISEVANILVEVLTALAAHCGESSSDKTWRDAATILLTNLLELQFDAYGQIDLRYTSTLIGQLPPSGTNPTHGLDEELQATLDLARQRAGDKRGYELQLAEDYIKTKWPKLPPETAGSIIFTLETVIDKMIRYPLRQLFFGETTFDLSKALSGDEQYVIILDLAVDVHGDVGRIGAVILKYLSQRIIKARPEQDESWLRPILIVCDEAQAFVSRNDTEFANVSRSYRGILMFATQNIANLKSTMGGGGTGVADCESMLGNFACRIVTLTNEMTTAQWLSDCLGKVYKETTGGGISITSGPDGTLSGGMTRDRRVAMDYDVQPRAWGTLKIGEAVVFGSFNGGHTFNVSRRRFLRVKFTQNAEDRRGAVHIIAPRYRS